MSGLLIRDDGKTQDGGGTCDEDSAARTSRALRQREWGWREFVLQSSRSFGFLSSRRARNGRISNDVKIERIITCEESGGCWSLALTTPAHANTTQIRRAPENVGMEGTPAVHRTSGATSAFSDRGNRRLDPEKKSLGKADQPMTLSKGRRSRRCALGCDHPSDV